LSYNYIFVGQCKSYQKIISYLEEGIYCCRIIIL